MDTGRTTLPQPTSMASTTSQHSFRLGLYHSREHLHSLQQTMYFDDAIYPHLAQPLLDRILRIRALVDHAAADLTAALGHIDDGAWW